VIPIPDRHALSIGVLTYDRGAHFCCYADPRALPGVEGLAGAIEDSIAELEPGNGWARPPRAKSRRGDTHRRKRPVAEQRA
jgi:hypothetical protein